MENTYYSVCVLWHSMTFWAARAHAFTDMRSMGTPFGTATPAPPIKIYR